MKTRPLLQWFLFLAVWLALLLPLWRLTARPPLPPSSRTVEVPADEDRNAVSMWATFRFAHDPLEVKVSRNGQEVWSASRPDRRQEAVWTLPLDDGRLELIVNVTWPEGTGYTVVECTLEPDGFPAASASAWGEDRIEALLHFTWHDPADHAPQQGETP